MKNENPLLLIELDRSASVFCALSLSTCHHLSSEHLLPIPFACVRTLKEVETSQPSPSARLFRRTGLGVPMSPAPRWSLMLWHQCLTLFLLLQLLLANWSPASPRALPEVCPLSPLWIFSPCPLHLSERHIYVPQEWDADCFGQLSPSTSLLGQNICASLAGWHALHVWPAHEVLTQSPGPTSGPVTLPRTESLGYRALARPELHGQLSEIDQTTCQRLPS